MHRPEKTDNDNNNNTIENSFGSLSFVYRGKSENEESQERRKTLSKRVEKHVNTGKNTGTNPDTNKGINPSKRIHIHKLYDIENE